MNIEGKETDGVLTRRRAWGAGRRPGAEPSYQDARQYLIALRIPTPELTQVDALAQSIGVTRSEVIRRAITQFVAPENGGEG